MGVFKHLSECPDQRLMWEDDLMLSISQIHSAVPSASPCPAPCPVDAFLNVPFPDVLVMLLDPWQNSHCSCPVEIISRTIAKLFIYLGQSLLYPRCLLTLLFSLMGSQAWAYMPGFTLGFFLVYFCAHSRQALYNLKTSPACRTTLIFAYFHLLELVVLCCYALWFLFFSF